VKDSTALNQIKKKDIEGNIKSSKEVTTSEVIDLNGRESLMSYQGLSLVKALAELSVVTDDFKSLAVTLLRFFDLKNPPPSAASDFLKLYDKLYLNVDKAERLRFLNLVRERMSTNASNWTFSLSVRNAIFRGEIVTNLVASDSVEIKLIDSLQSDKNFEAFVSTERQIEKKNKFRLLDLLDQYILSRSRSRAYWQIDLHSVSIYEKYRQYNSAKEIAAQLLEIKTNPLALRSLFRICRLTNDYTSVDSLMLRSPAIAKIRNFNVLYELVYYYESKKDVIKLNSVLRTIENAFTNNLPVYRTLRNFYIRFGMIDDLKRIEPIIQNIDPKRVKHSKQFEDEVAESEAEAVSKIQELYSELEHQKQLAAISDLTTGISHELGQPITNIRYSIQYFKKKIERRLTEEDVIKVLDSILEETVRMGGLISRLAPLTSSRNILEEFDLMDRIKRRVEAELPKLTVNKIRVLVAPSEEKIVFGDKVKFDQLISNLLLNAIDAVAEVERRREIKFNVIDEGDNYKLMVSDTGRGVPVENRQKIFDPFFSTKAPGKGEGLGLFIVWNVLQSVKGSISVDPRYNSGAKFNIHFPKNFTLVKV